MSRNRMRWTLVVGAVLGALLAGALLYMRGPGDSSSTTREPNGAGEATVRASLQLIGLAQAAYSRGEYADAERSLEAALKEAEAGQARAWEVAHILHVLAAVYIDWGRYDEAQAVLKRSVAILEEAGEQDAGPRGFLAAPLCRLAEVHRAKREYAEAERVLHRAIEVLEGRPGLDQRCMLGSVLALLGEVHRDQGEDAEAESAYRRSLDIHEQEAPLPFRPAAAALSGLARLHAERGDDEEAEVLFRRAIAVWETVEGLQDLAALLRRTGREPEADALEARAKALKSSGSKDEEE